MTENNTKTEIGQRLQEVRKNKKLSVNDFSNKLNIKPRTYSSYERGEALPSIDFIINFITTFDLSSDWVLFGTSSMYKKDDFLTNFKESYSLSDKKLNTLNEVLENPEMLNVLFLFTSTLKGDKEALEVLKMINKTPSMLKVMYGSKE